MNYLVKEDLILINRKTVEKHGGNFVPPDNFLHPQEFDYLVEAIDAKVFGESLYPTLADKVCKY